LTNSNLNTEMLKVKVIHSTNIKLKDNYTIFSEDTEQSSMFPEFVLDSHALLNF